jgi:hypothetical protein
MSNSQRVAFTPQPKGRGFSATNIINVSRCFNTTAKMVVGNNTTNITLRVCPD